MSAGTPDPAETFVRAFSPSEFPRDLILVYAWLVATIVAIYVPFINETPLRIVLGLGMVLFIPGYTLIAALFPGKEDLDGIERTALSFGLSIAVVPLLGLVLNYTPWGIRLDPIVTVLVVFTLAMGLISQYRRAVLPPEERFTVPFSRVRELIQEESGNEERSRMDRVLSAILVFAIIAAVGTTILVIAVPKEGEKFTEFYILGDKHKAADYPTTLSVGTPASVIIGIGNHEYRNVTYHVETWLVNMSFDETTNESILHGMQKLGEYRVSDLPHNTTSELQYNFTAEDPDFNRIEFLLFNETVPSSSVTGLDRINQSYRDLHLWVKIRPALVR